MRTVELDVREDLRNGREPFDKIMAAVSSLGDEDVFVLYATFEPVPLYGVLGVRGWQHEAEPLSDGDWRITFRKGT